MLIRRFVVLNLALALAASVGCTTVQKSMVAGAAVGAGVGGGLAASHGILSAGEGMAVGAAGGATLGALVADYRDNYGQQSLRDALDEKDRMLAECQEQVRSLQTQLAAANADLAAKDREIARLQGQVDRLTAELANCKGAHVELTLLADVLFNPGSNVLSDRGKEALNDAVGKIKEMGSEKFVTVQGHTDSDPIRASNWKDNWDLGAARSLAVLRYLISQGIAAENMAAMTFSHYQPVSETDKSQNRRAVIVIHTGWPRF